MNEDQLRLALKRESEAVTASPLLKVRVDARRGGRSNIRVRTLAIAGVAIAVVIALVAYLATRPEEKQGLTGTPPNTYFAGYWPAHDLAHAETLQQRMGKNGVPTWQWSPLDTANEYAGQLGWTERSGTNSYPQVSSLHDGVVRGSAHNGWTATEQITPQIPPYGRPGVTHTIHFIGLKGTRKPAWFVSGITDPNLAVSSPDPESYVDASASVSGNAMVPSGTITITALDDDGHQLARATVTVGTSQMAPFRQTLALTEPSTRSGIVRFEGTSPAGLPSTDVTILRVRFDRSTWPDATKTTPAPPSPQPQLASGIDGEEWGSGTVPNGSGKHISYAHARLVRRTFTGGSVLVPAAWVYSNQTIPSDHDDLLFYDPANPTARFEITATRCTGCVTNYRGSYNAAGDPRLVLPQHTTTSHLFDGGAAAAFAEQPWLGYDVSGVSRVTRANGKATGSIVYRVALPVSDGSVATQILNSVTFAWPTP
jgi:hypothetical protein